jgi:hypothetical protein
MDHLHRRRRRQQNLTWRAIDLTAEDDQRRPHPLAAGEHAVAHRGVQTLRIDALARQQPIERTLHLGTDLG